MSRKLETLTYEELLERLRRHQKGTLIVLEELERRERTKSCRIATEQATPVSGPARS